MESITPHSKCKVTKELGESDYAGSMQKSEQKDATPTAVIKTEVKPRRGEGAYLRGSGKRAFEDSFAGNSQERVFGRTDLKPRRR